MVKTLAKQLGTVRSLRLLPVMMALLLLAACSADYQRVFITPRGPGSLTIVHAQGDTFCRAFEDSIEHCGYGTNANSNEAVTITAVPDEGHEFVGWSPRHPTSWNSDLDASTNPLVLKIDGDYILYANFR